MTLNDWLARYKSALGSDYEVLFVSTVLTHVSRLDPNSLVAQYPFKDDRGGNRYCDFVIREGADLRVAIEIDGYDKTGRGQGMTRSEFLDWQIRQSSLVSQGWRVLRFANIQVRDEPRRCAELLNLLLREERTKESHRRSLANRIRELEAKIESQTIGSKNPDVHEELEALQTALNSATQASQLTADERNRLNDLEQAQLKVQVLEKETNVMKTTIWAFTVLIGLMLVLLFNRNEKQIATTSVEHASVNAQLAQLPEQPSKPSAPVEVEPQVVPASVPVRRSEPQVVPAKTNEAVFEPTLPPVQATPEPTSLAGSSCSQPLPWAEARNRVGKVVAIVGPVSRVANREDVRGSPTFITIGRLYPSRDRVEVVIWGNRQHEFTQTLESGLEGRDICVFSEIAERDGVPQIVLRNRSELVVR